MRRLAALLTASALGLLAQPGRTDRQAVDPVAAARGQRVYTQFCIDCHGSRAQGTADGPDLIRSVPVLRDRLGSELGPALKKLAHHQADLSPSQLTDLSHFLKQRIEYTIRDRNATKEPNVLTGNAEAGKAYFNGAGQCIGCHSPTGDLAGIARRYSPIALQQRFLFPRSGRGAKPMQVVVTPQSGAPVSGTLEQVDDFNVSLRDSSGDYRAFRRGPGLTVELHDPYAAHILLLDQYTGPDIHNLTTYLETLK